MNIINPNFILPAVALRGMTILPGTSIHFDLNRKKSIIAVEKAMMEGRRIFLVMQKDMESEGSECANPECSGLYSVGVSAIIKQVTKLPGNIIRVLAEGLSRAELLSINEENEEYLEVVIREAEEERDVGGATEEAMLRHSRELVERYLSFAPQLKNNHVEERYQHIGQLGDFIDRISMNIPIGSNNKQILMEAFSVRKRYEIFSEILLNEIEILQIKTELSQKIKEKIDKNQRDYFLREQMHVIQEELGDGDSFSEADRYTQALANLKADKEVKEKIKKEIKRFKSLAGSSSESAVERAYIETVLELPWNKASKDNKDMDKAEHILNRDHYGLRQVKERILEFLAVHCLTREGESPILCLVGPPGIGKTSIAKSIAEALNRKYVRICLGGVRDEAEIRGHRKTYVGAMSGRIAAGLRQAGVCNPLMLLDEIDKVSNDYKGDTFSALLEVLDGEQNVTFRDHYVEIPINLSPVLFIATANTTATIPRPLLDRMEIIEINSYTVNEKFHIAKEHLLEKQFTKNGIAADMLHISDSALKKIITDHTKEAGVRELERKIREVCRKAAREILQAKQSRQEGKSIKITLVTLEGYLGKPKYTQNKARENDEIGIVRGLAWTSVGGNTLEIEVNVMPGKGKIDLTGQMGDVMKESARTALSYVRSISNHYHLPEELFQKNDFHIHIPEGAVPKDGPSAGITIATALLSAVAEIPVKADVALTGEVTLRGRVLPVGGLKEKVLAAQMAGVKTVLVPLENKKDIQEIDEEIKEGLKIHYVKTMEDVLQYALVEKRKNDCN